ncbi:MAG: homocysteine S-methyltransferase family protein [Saprospiraceae bacterium]|nr:homocysteine S-methyltransferase family protein [Saprospiraceae bacterium]
MKKELLLDGAVGTVLEGNEYRGKEGIWTARAALERPGLLNQIHRDYVAAGADVITAHTFRTSPYAFTQAGYTPDQAWEALTAAVQVAQSAARESTKKILVAGSIAPLEDCYRPDAVPGAAILEEFHSLQLEWLQRSGVDLILAETINNLKEALTIIRISNRLNLRLWLSLLPGPDSDFKDLESLSNAIRALQSHSVDTILLNCRPAVEMKEWVRAFAGISKPWGVYANGPGCPDAACGWDPQGLPFEANFIDPLCDIRAMGASVIGGCCGSTPEMIRALKEKLAVPMHGVNNIPVES